MSVLRRLATLRSDTRGISAVEFAIVAPVLLGLVMGSIQFAIDVYVKAVLTGAVQQAGRDSGIEDAMATQTPIDDQVEAQVLAILPSAVVTFTRRNYQNFGDVGTKEVIIDKNESDGKPNGVLDDDECYWDENNSGTWDDGALTGQGSARDIVVYTATVEYTELLPLKALLGLGDQRSLQATTTLMNQPFASQKPRPEPVKRGGCL